MRRTLACAAASLCLLTAACGGDDDDTADTRITAPASAPDSTADAQPTTSGATPSTVAGKPTVSIPETIPTELKVSVLTPGSGDAAATGDTVIVDYVGVRSEDGTEFDNSYDRGEAFPVTLGSGGVIQGWDEGLVGAQAGSRIQLDIPADKAYGNEARGDVIRAGDALTFLIDVRAVVPATSPEEAPEVEPMLSSGATELTLEDVVEGSGATAVAGGNVVAHLIVWRGDTGEEIDNTWTSGQPQTLRLDETQLVAPLVDGIAGMKVGGRRSIIAPPSAGLGADVMERLGLPPETDVVFLVDLLAAY